MTQNDLFNIAKLVYPNESIFISDGYVYMEMFFDAEIFDPKLDGSLIQKAQACECIVFANKICHEGFITRLALGDEPLTAALRAILQWDNV
jgi:hypothetical protein